MVGGDEIVWVVIVTFGEGVFKLLAELTVSTTVALVDEHGGEIKLA